MLLLLIAEDRPGRYGVCQSVIAPDAVTLTAFGVLLCSICLAYGVQRWQPGRRTPDVGGDGFGAAA